ncbi:MAG: hypothetical protein WCE63_16885 [Acidobacteriaceae bacterium]
MELIVVNACGWLVLQLAIAWGMTRVSAKHFARDRRWTQVHSWEIDLYRRWLRVRRWKAMLPDGAPWVGGTFHKRYLDRRDSAYLRQLVSETRRGELAHWLMLGCFPIFFFWNPPWVWGVMAFYAAAANLPCIVVQRYNREIAMRLLQHRKFHFPIPQSAASPQSEIHFISRV